MKLFDKLLVNALIHRDYFTSASIRLMVFADRVEIISPGHLPYRGLGTGIPRALHDWPASGTGGATPGVTPGVAPEVIPEVAGEVLRLLSVMEGEMNYHAEMEEHHAAMAGVAAEKSNRVNRIAGKLKELVS